jgi:hypothetical protein
VTQHHASFGQGRLLISVLGQYLTANDAGPGFYDLAQRKKLLRPRPSPDEKLAFWVGHVNAVPTPGDRPRSSARPAITNRARPAGLRTQPMVSSGGSGVRFLLGQGGDGEQTTAVVTKSGEKQ